MPPNPERVDAIAATLPPEAWHTRTIKEGSKGPIVADFAYLRVVASRDGLPGPEVWLLLRRSLSEQPELRAYLSNAPPDTPLETLVWACGMRWTIDTDFEDCKGELGMDHYEVRGWRGWHHHMTMTILSHHFLVRLRLRLGERAPALTLPQVRIMLTVVLPSKQFDPESVLKLLRYYQQRNYAAYCSHRKRQLNRLKELGKL